MSALAAEGLIVQRDSLAGPFQSLPAKIPKLTQDDVDNIYHWSPSVRADIIDFILQSPLAFQANDQVLEVQGIHNGAAQMVDRDRTVFSLWHVEEIPSGNVPGNKDVHKPTLPNPPIVTPYRLAQMVRPTRAGFKKQLRFLDGYAALRDERAAEILTQVDSPIPYLGAVVGLRQDRNKWTLELMEAVVRLARQVEMRFKAALACRRPGELSPNIQPMIATPAHSSLPSGHSTEAFAMATVLNAIVRQGRAQGANGADNAKKTSWDRYAQMLSMVAARVGVNRTVAGVHFPVDTAAGCTLGVTIGRYFLWRCGAQQIADDGKLKWAGAGDPLVTAYEAWMFEAWGYDGYEDFSRSLQVEDGTADVQLKEARHTGPVDPAAGKRIEEPFQYRLEENVDPTHRPDKVLDAMFKNATGEWD
ncbi:MAG: phosphatase PAP2 family protein [Roseobacter sp.]